MSEAPPPVIEQYGYTWIQHADGLYYGPIYPGDDDELVRLELAGDLGIARCGRGSTAISSGIQRSRRRRLGAMENPPRDKCV